MPRGCARIASSLAPSSRPHDSSARAALPFRLRVGVRSRACERPRRTASGRASVRRCATCMQHERHGPCDRLRVYTAAAPRTAPHKEHSASDPRTVRAGPRVVLRCRLSCPRRCVCSAICVNSSNGVMFWRFRRSVRWSRFQSRFFDASAERSGGEVRCDLSGTQTKRFQTRFPQTV